MAISNTDLLQTKKPLSLPLLAITTIFLILLNRVNSSDSLSFSFNSFNPVPRDLILQGDAQIRPFNRTLLSLQLTGPYYRRVGRALYSGPLHLWDQSTGNVASFETTFTFVLTSPRSTPADGIAFFIATPDTTIPPKSYGGYLGLFSPETALDSSMNQVVAVEFDTFTGNRWDPYYRHIGIDVKSIKSSAVTRWERREGEIVTAHVTYNPAHGKLRVVSSYPNGDSFTVSCAVDLKTVLPEWVRIGFSASTGDEIETHRVLSWSFSSSLQGSEAKEEDVYNIIARYV